MTKLRKVCFELAILTFFVAGLAGFAFIGGTFQLLSRLLK